MYASVGDQYDGCYLKSGPALQTIFADNGRPSYTKLPNPSVQSVQRDPIDTSKGGKLWSPPTGDVPGGQANFTISFDIMVTQSSNQRRTVFSHNKMPEVCLTPSTPNVLSSDTQLQVCMNQMIVGKTCAQLVPLILNEWTNIVFSVSPTKLIVYKNGTISGTEITGYFLLPNFGGDWTWGDNPSGPVWVANMRYWDGIMRPSKSITDYVKFTNKNSIGSAISPPGTTPTTYMSNVTDPILCAEACDSTTGCTGFSISNQIGLGPDQWYGCYLKNIPFFVNGKWGNMVDDVSKDTWVKTS